MAKKTKKIQLNGANQALYLGESLAVGSVPSLAQELSSLMEQTPAGLVLDASGTEAVSTAGAQLLLVLARTLEGRGAALRLQEPTAAFCESMKLLGLGDHLTRWTAV